MEDLVGKKVIAFNFKGVPGYTSSMKKIEGQIGKIVRKSDTYCSVTFRGLGSWSYPYPEILNHLVDEEPEIELSLDELINNVKNLISKI